MKNKRICFKCDKVLSNRSKPTVYTIEQYPRLGAPEHVYLCAQCAKKNAPTLETLLNNYQSKINELERSHCE